MSTVQEREALKAVYKNRKWALKVAKMTDAQVIAIFKRLKFQNKL